MCCGRRLDQADEIDIRAHAELGLSRVCLVGTSPEHDAHGNVRMQPRMSRPEGAPSLAIGLEGNDDRICRRRERARFAVERGTAALARQRAGTGEHLQRVVPACTTTPPRAPISLDQDPRTGMLTWPAGEAA